MPLPAWAVEPAAVTFVTAAALGLLQGVTEFLPVSSTAHLLIGGRLLGFEDPGGAFTIMIQLGSILAVVWLYRAKVAAVAAGLPSDPAARRFLAAIAIACLPGLAAGVLFADYIRHVLYESPVVIAWALMAGGVVMLAVERLPRVPDVHDAARTPLVRALGIGACQMIALVPGVSRSGATIVGGLLMRLDRVSAAEFSFFLAMPTMMGAFAYDLVAIWGETAPGRAAEIAVGFMAAFLASLAVVRPFLGFVRQSGFGPFAWYRIAVGAVLLAGGTGGWSW